MIHSAVRSGLRRRGTMDCTECKQGLAENARFCSSCGSPVRSNKLHDAAPGLSKTEAVKQYAQDVAHEAGDLGKAALKSDLGKKMAAGAALGAVIAVPVPFVGPAVGAV